VDKDVSKVKTAIPLVINVPCKVFVKDQVVIRVVPIMVIVSLIHVNNVIKARVRWEDVELNVSTAMIVMDKVIASLAL